MEISVVDMMLRESLDGVRAARPVLAQGRGDGARGFMGERFVPGYTDGATELEHVHRYCLALPYAADRKVLDVACGEGYGSDLLAQVADSVLGVDIDAQTVLAAAARYQRANLSFMTADATSIPIEDASIDIVVSFETIEHVEDQAGLWREIKRVLKPEGILVISSPNRDTYRAERSPNNEFHIKELSQEELEADLSRSFVHYQTYDQAIIFGSLVMPRPGQDANHLPYSAVSLDSETGLLDWRVGKELLAPFSLAVASDMPVEPAGPSLYKAHYPSNAMAALAGGLAERDQLIATLRDQLNRIDAEKEIARHELASAVEKVRLLSETLAEQEGNVRSLQGTLAEARDRFAVQLQAARQKSERSQG